MWSWSCARAAFAGRFGATRAGGGGAVVRSFEGQHLVGIITERDLTAAVADGADPVATPVSDYVTPAPEVLRPDSELDAARVAM